MVVLRILVLVERVWYKVDWEDIEDKILWDCEWDWDWEEFGNILVY